MAVVRLGLAVGFGVLFMCGAVTAYEPPVHLSLTAALAFMAGFEDAEAFEVSRWNQGTDDNPATSPMMLSVLPEHVDVRANYHFVSETRLLIMQRDAGSCTPDNLGEKNYQAIGQYLHALQDSFSHIGYGPYAGHASMGHAPDKPWYEPAHFQAMVRVTLGELVAVRDRCITKPAPATRRPLLDAINNIVSEWASQEIELTRWMPPSTRAADVNAAARWNALFTNLLGKKRQLYVDQLRDEYGKWLAKQRSGPWKN